MQGKRMLAMLVAVFMLELAVIAVGQRVEELEKGMSTIGSPLIAPEGDAFAPDFPWQDIAPPDTDILPEDLPPPDDMPIMQKTRSLWT